MSKRPPPKPGSRKARRRPAKPSASPRLPPLRALASTLRRQVAALHKRQRQQLASGPAPATDAALAQVWDRWYACPASLTPAERAVALTALSGYRLPANLKSAIARLERRFGNPLSETEFGEAINAAHWWAEFIGESLPAALSLGRARLDAAARFDQFDADAPGHVAVWRTARELWLLGGGLLRQTRPSLAEIKRARDLYTSYLSARQQARRKLAEVLHPPRLRAGPPQTFADVPLGQPRGVPANVPRHLQIAQLAALGQAPRTVANYMATRFLKLTKDQQADFLRVFRAPAQPLARCHPGLAVWLADNAPLLRRLPRQWHDVEALAAQTFPSDQLPASLRNYADAQGIRFDFKRGANFINRDGLKPALVRSLLTALPALCPASPA